MTKEQNVLMLAKECGFTYTQTAQSQTRNAIRAFADALIKPLEVKIAEQQKELDSAKNQNPVAWLYILHSNRGVRSVSVLRDRRGQQEYDEYPLYAKPFSTKELDDCKDAVVILRAALNEVHEQLIKDKVFTQQMHPTNYWRYVVNNALSATSKLVEGYKK